MSTVNLNLTRATVTKDAHFLRFLLNCTHIDKSLQTYIGTLRHPAIRQASAPQEPLARSREVHKEIEHKALLDGGIHVFLLHGAPLGLFRGGVGA